jgi:hypothetical protein
MKNSSIFATNKRTMLDFFTPTVRRTSKLTYTKSSASDSNKLHERYKPTPVSDSCLDVHETTEEQNGAGGHGKNYDSSLSTTGGRKRRYEQLYLDFGQASFGARTLCPTCNTLYVHGMEEDAINHQKICDEYIHGVLLHGFKHSRVYPVTITLISGKTTEAKVMEVRSTDPSHLVGKLASVKYIVDQEMGFAASNNHDDILDNRVAFMCVLNKRVIGLCIVEVISKAFSVVDVKEDDNGATVDGHASDHSIRPICTTRRYSRSLSPSQAHMGVYQIWCHKSYRRLGVSKALLNLAREKLIYGMVIPRDMVAFSSPTTDGFYLACNYMDTEYPLIYDCM